MKYKELYTATTGVFAKLKDLQADLYQTLFGETDTAVLDAYAYFIASERTFVPTFTSDTETAYLTALFYNVADSWNRMYKALTAEYDVTKSNTTVETTTGTDTTDTVGTVTDTDSDKAFNSTDYVGTGKSERATDNNNARKYDIEKQTVKGSDNIQGEIESEILIRTRYTLLQVITTDIINKLTLSVYE